MDTWSSGDWVTFAVTIVVVLGILFLLWQSPRSRMGIGLRLWWQRLRGRR